MNELSEADLLEELLGMLDDNGIFKLGMLMSVMSKGHLDHIKRMTYQAEQFLEQIASLERSLNEAERDIRKLNEQDSQS